MHASNFGGRRLTELDFTRLEKIAASARTPQLAKMLDDADIIPGTEIPADVVTMYSQFVLSDLDVERRQTLTLCYPHDTDPAKGMISVLSPAGLSLIGQPVGAVVRWAGPAGGETVARIEEVLFQPEASGDFVR